MKRCRFVALLCAAVALAPPAARGEKGRRASGAADKGKSSSTISVKVRVVDVSGDRAYIEPGSEQGLRLGDTVRFGSQTFEVVAVTRATAAVAIDDRSLSTGARGTALVPAGRPEKIVLKPPEPTPLSSFRGAWPVSERPAASQSPEAIPLVVREPGPNRVVLQDAVYAVLPLDDNAKFVGNELRGRVHFEPLARKPLGLDADIGVLTFAGDDFDLRPGAAARAVLRVRELNLSYGKGGDFRGALGRLRGTSTVLGELDGLRLEAPLTAGLVLSAFGGTAPQTFNGMLSTEVALFGSELSYFADDSALRPRVVVGAHASRFDGALDERKAYATVDLMPGRSRIGAHTEVSFFDSDNPWNAHSVEVSAAGLDAEIVVDIFHVGGRAELRRPDRTRYLLSLLPLEWLCWGDPQAPDAPCDGSDASYRWLLDAGAHVGKFSVDFGGQSSFTKGTDASNFGGFTSLRFIDLIGRVHLGVDGSVYSGSLIRTASAEVSPGVVFAGGNADASLHYRLSGSRYRADLDSFVEHGVGARLWASPSDRMDFDVQADWLRGREVDALVLQAVVGLHLGP